MLSRPRTLGEYRRIATGKRLPGYVRASRRRIGGKDPADLGIDELWTLHDFPTPPSRGSATSILDCKIEIAERLLSHCTLCERRCGADRTSGEKGFCGVGARSSYFYEDILWGEEKPLVPSHEVFFSGCNMRCSYCYSYEGVLDTDHGRPFYPSEFAGIVDARRREVSGNLNLIGGEPTVHLPSILRTLRNVTTRLPVVWNSNFLMSEETMKLLDGIADLYVGDFRFGCDRCALTLADTPDYFAVAERNFKTAAANGYVIVRHLLLPGHAECCLLPIARWVSENLPGIPFHLMFQYTPCHRALDDKTLARTLHPDEEARALEIVKEFGLNTTRWNRPLPNEPEYIPESGHEVEATITIGPDGRVCIMKLHGELLGLAESLANGGNTIGG